jgi:ATP synthase protein I
MRGFAAGAQMWSRFMSRPIRTALRWQLLATAVLAVLFGLLSGVHGAMSAALGGLVITAAGVAFGLMGFLAQGKPAQLALLGMLRAEAVKIGLTVVLLWLVLTLYDKVVMVDLIASFVISTLIFSLAAFARDH